MEFIRVNGIESFNRIPRYLFEQIKGRSWSVDRLFEYADSIISNPSTLFWVVEDGNKQIKGILWIVIDVLSRKLNVIAFYTEMDIPTIIEVRDFLRGIASGLELKEKINWVTNEPEKLKEIGGEIPETIIVEV